MADYGAIGVCYRQDKQYTQLSTSRCSTSQIRAATPISATAAHNAIFTPSKLVSGQVMQDGSPVSRLLRVYCRATGELLRSGQSSPSTGAFSIPVGPFSGQVYVIVFDDTGTAPDYNAQILDLVIPG